MDLSQIIAKQYDLEPITHLVRTVHGSGRNTFFVETRGGNYVAKLNVRLDFIRIYDKVQQELTQWNLLQSKIIRTRLNQLTTPEGVVLYQHIQGENHKLLTPLQVTNALKYMRKYHQALRQVSFEEIELTVENHWDLAGSLEFITQQFPEYLSQINVSLPNRQALDEGIRLLTNHYQQMAEAPSQLIHSDLGADNFIFQGDKVVSIIDFTPQYTQEIYALAQFIYWNQLWHQPIVERDRLADYLKMSGMAGTADEQMLHLHLVRAALFRIIGPLMENLTATNPNYDYLHKRFAILTELVRHF